MEQLRGFVPCAFFLHTRMLDATWQTRTRTHGQIDTHARARTHRNTQMDHNTHTHKYKHTRIYRNTDTKTHTLKHTHITQHTPPPLTDETTQTHQSPIQSPTQSPQHYMFTPPPPPKINKRYPQHFTRRITNLATIEWLRLHEWCSNILWMSKLQGGRRGGGGGYSAWTMS